MIEVDTWCLSRNTAFIMQPLAEALSVHPDVQLRRINGTPQERPQWMGAPVPELVLPVPMVKSALARYPFDYLRARQRLGHFYKTARPIVHITMPSPFDLLYLTAVKAYGATVLVSVHDANPHPGEENPVLRAIGKRLYGMADHLVAVSHFVGAELRRARQFAVPVHVVRDGLIEELGPPAAPRPGPRGRPMRLLFHGRIRHYKGVDLVLDAVRILNQREVPVELTISGAGDTTHLSVLAASLPNVRTLLRKTTEEERAALYASHDISVLPYREASQSGVALRSLFAAMPAVATRVGALPEQLRDGVDAVFAESVTAVGIADAIEHLVTQMDYEALSRNAAASAAGKGAEAITGRWASLYRHLLSPQARRESDH